MKALRLSSSSSTVSMLTRRNNMLNQSSNRVLSRTGARILTPEEAAVISAGAGTNTFHITGVPPILDAFGDHD